MALIQCPNCGRQTSEILSNCKYCEASLPQKQIEDINEQILFENSEPIKQKPLKISFLKIASIVIVVVLLVVVGVYFMLKNSTLFTTDNFSSGKRGDDNSVLRPLTFEESRRYVDSTAKVVMKVEQLKDSSDRIESQRQDSLRIRLAEPNDETNNSEHSNNINASSADLPEWLPKKGLVAWYPFDSGVTIDKSGNKRHCNGSSGTVDGVYQILKTSDRNDIESSALKFMGDGEIGYLYNTKKLF